MKDFDDHPDPEALAAYANRETEPIRRTVGRIETGLLCFYAFVFGFALAAALDGALERSADRMFIAVGCVPFIAGAVLQHVARPVWAATLANVLFVILVPISAFALAALRSWEAMG